MLSIKKFKNESKETSYDFSILYDGLNKSPDLFGLISLSSKKASDLSRAIGIVSDFVVTKFGESNLSLLSRLGSIQRETLDLIMSVPIDTDDEIDFYLGLLSVETDTFYVYFEQESFNIFIRRNGKNIWINKDSNDVMFTGSGKLKNGDFIYLLTKHTDIDELVETNVENNLGAGIILEYNEGDAVIVPQLIVSTPTIDTYDEEEPVDEEPLSPQALPLPKNPTFDKKKRFPQKTIQGKLLIFKNNFGIYFLKYSKIVLRVVADTIEWIIDFVLIKLSLKKPNLIRSPSKNLRVRIGFVAIIIFIILVVFLIFKSVGDNTREQNNKKSYDNLMQQIDGEVTTLNKSATPLNFTALTNITQIQSDLTKAQTYTKYINEQKINDYKANILESQDKINEITPLQDADILTVIGAKFPGVKTKSLTILDSGKIIVLSDSKNLYQIDPSNPINISEIVIADIQSPKYIASLGNRVFVYDDQKGLNEVDITAKKITLLPGFSNIGTITDMQTFDGKIYLLSSSTNKIYRSVQVGNSFSIPSEYNPSSPLPDGSMGFAIDGKVFVVTNSGVLQRYYTGKLDSDTNIVINGLQKPFSGNVKIATNAYSQNSSTNEVYILDPGGNRILKVNKDTTSLESQYVYRGSKTRFTDLKAIVLSSDQKTLYALDSDYIFKLSLSQ